MATPSQPLLSTGQGPGTGGSEDHWHCQHQWQSHGWWDEGAEPEQSDSKAAGSQEEGSAVMPPEGLFEFCTPLSRL